MPGSNTEKVLKNPQPEHRGFLSFLRHPFRKPTPKPAEADMRHRICKDKGKHGGCVVSIATNENHRCRPGEYWDGSGCVTNSLFRMNDCSNLALTLQRQAREVQLAESQRQTSCSRDASAQECSELTAKAQDAEARYQSLQRQYDECRRQRVPGSLNTFGIN